MGMTMAWYRAGGPLMHLIAVTGIVGLVILVERFYVIAVRSKTTGRLFTERVIQLVRGGRIDEAIKECAGSGSALADIGLLILRSRSRDETDLRNVADTASLVVVPNLTRRLPQLAVLAAAALLLGVLGTVLELRRALGAIGGGGATDRTISIASGISSSLEPVSFALVVAIVLIVGNGYLTGRSTLIVSQIQELSARLINALIDRPDVRLGHR